jgi:hypothetical protein
LEGDRAAFEAGITEAPFGRGDLVRSGRPFRRPILCRSPVSMHTSSVSHLADQNPLMSDETKFSVRFLPVVLGLAPEKLSCPSLIFSRQF